MHILDDQSFLIGVLFILTIQSRSFVTCDCGEGLRALGNDHIISHVYVTKAHEKALDTKAQVNFPGGQYSMSVATHCSKRG